MRKLRISYLEIDIERRVKRWLSRQGRLKLLVVFENEDEGEDGKVVRNTCVFIHIPIPMYLESIMIELQVHDENRICPAGLLSVFLSHSANPMGIVLIPDPIMYHQLPLILQGSAYHQWNDQSSYHESHGW